jgi:hypothetical protein
MPTTNDRISLVNDTEDVTAVKAPPPGLIRESKLVPAVNPLPLGAADDDGAATPPPVVAPAKRGPMAPAVAKPAPTARAGAVPVAPKSQPPAKSIVPARTTSSMPAKPLDAKTAAANAVTTMAAVASTSGPAAKPRLTGKTLAPPPLSRPLASILAPASPAAKPEILGPTPSVGLPALGSGALPFIRPSARASGTPIASATVSAPGARSESASPEGARPDVPGPTPRAGLAALGSGALSLMRPTIGLSTGVPHPRERRPPTPAGGSPGALVDLVSLASSSGPLLTQNPDAWGRRSPAPRSRVVLSGALAVALLAGGTAIAWKQWWSARPGRIEISTTPAGATVTLAGDAEAHRAPVAFEKPPGHYTISVARDGFQRDDRAVDLHAGQDVVLSIALAPVPPPQPPAIVPEPLGGTRPGAGARRATAGARTPAGRPSMAAFTARATARAMALASATQDDEANPPVMAATIPGAPAPRGSEAAPPPAASAAKSGSSSASVTAAVPTTAPAPAAKAAPLEKSGPPPAEIAGARTISGRLAKALLAIDSNADEYRVKLPPSLARAEMKLSAVVKMCVSAEGKVADLKLLKPADPAIDAQIPAVLGKWRYKPLVVDGRAVPFCYVLQYEIASP